MEEHRPEAERSRALTQAERFVEKGVKGVVEDVRPVGYAEGCRIAVFSDGSAAWLVDRRFPAEMRVELSEGEAVLALSIHEGAGADDL